MKKYAQYMGFLPETKNNVEENFGFFVITS